MNIERVYFRLSLWFVRGVWFFLFRSHYQGRTGFIYWSDLRRISSTTLSWSVKLIRCIRDDDWNNTFMTSFWQYEMCASPPLCTYLTLCCCSLYVKHLRAFNSDSCHAKSVTEMLLGALPKLCFFHLLASLIASLTASRIRGRFSRN